MAPQDYVNLFAFKGIFSLVLMQLKPDMLSIQCEGNGAENQCGEQWMSHCCFTDVSKISTWSIFSSFSLYFPVYVLSASCFLLLSWKQYLAWANYRADSKLQGGMWWGMLVLLLNATVDWRQVMETPPCLIWSCFFEIPDIYWPILIRSV